MSEKENTTNATNEELQEDLNNEATQEELDNAGESTDNNHEEKAEPSLEEKFAELNNKYVRLYSDFDNFRKRTIKEKADIISTANGALMTDLIGTLDDFERAISNNEKVDDIDSLREGFKLIYNKFSSTLKNKGLEAMDCKGDIFDADKHEAITNIPVENEEDKGKIVDVIERGYNLRGKVLRYAKVVVGQ
ncbi:nucleotide exchange factor GrpE [Crocinitomix algicola]|uniref:nucleotide exchange factor GrpE n=1 Tax=Crocinitomix algicola TaxID=1740263 RepID=UPI0009F41077|nr:nucleotide exchange factor GrpE [Crocinitomix algicola]